ncbi:MAG TPA: HupE/UreJ family protein [Vicinamibacterales bacterium]|jgi:hypothetical protein
MRSQLALIAFLVILVVPAFAHDVVVDQIVDMTFRAATNQLTVSVRVPASLLADANLPHRSDGTLDNPRAASLQAVADDVARNLDVEQDDEALPGQRTAVRAGADGKSVDIELTYATRGPATAISARLNAFRGTPLAPPRTNAQFVPVAGTARTISISGDATRVRFDPGVVETIQRFAALALRSTLALGDHLLFAVCLLLPARRWRTAARLLSAMIAGQLVSIALSSVRPVTSSEWQLAMAAVAASALLVAALQNLIRTRVNWTAFVAAWFGVFNGFAFGDAFANARQLAGGHSWMAAAAAAFVVLFVGAELWLAAIVWAVRDWFERLQRHGAILTALGSVLIAHEAFHRAVDRGHQLPADGPFDAPTLFFWIAMTWIAVMLVSSALQAWQERRSRSTSMTASEG